MQERLSQTDLAIFSGRLINRVIVVELGPVSSDEATGAKSLESK